MDKHKTLLSFQYLLDATACEKATLQSILTVPLFGFFMLWVWFTWHFTDFGQTYFRPEGVRLNFILGFSGLVAWIIMSGIGLWLRRKKRDSALFVTVMVLLYGISLVPLAYTIGIFTPLTGIVLLGAPLVGFIMFGFRDVLWSFGVNLAGLSVLSTLTSLGMLPYAPLFDSSLGQAYNAEHYWLLSQIVCGGPFVLTAFGITYSLLTRWKAREAEALKMSLTDYLTGASNRRAVLDVIATELHSVRKDSRPFAVVILDLDHFKSINDSHGHELGDRVLVSVVACLEEALRDTDCVGRYGGEEFVLVLPGSDTPTAIHVIERVRQAMAGLAFDTGKEEPLRVSASYGLFVVTGEPGSPRPTMEDVLMHADEALYQAKEAGRDCYRVWDGGYQDEAALREATEDPPKTPHGGGVPG